VATITYDAEGPGKGASGRPVFAQSPRPIKVVTGTYAFDSSYPTGGEDISDIFNQFANLSSTSGLLGLLFDQPLTGAQTGKFLKVDYTNKKVQLFTNASPAVEVTNASDQSAITGLRFVAWGYV
jgi:hypothetical protein